jgi:hypothetical protein
MPSPRTTWPEPSREALAREIQEELGARPRVGRLLWIIESFFALDGKRYHEFGLYFLIALPASIPTTGQFDAFDPHYRLIMQWLPLKDLPPVVPIFLRTALLNPPDVPCWLYATRSGCPMLLDLALGDNSRPCGHRGPSWIGSPPPCLAISSRLAE